MIFQVLRMLKISDNLILPLQETDVVYMIIKIFYLKQQLNVTYLGIKMKRKHQLYLLNN